MTSPTVLAAYTFAFVWLTIKYRLLLKRGNDNYELAALLAPALLVAASLAVVPYVEIRGTAWCSQVDVDRLSAAVLLLGAVVPVFDSGWVWPGVGTVSAALTAAFLARSQCYGVAAVLVCASACSAMALAARALGSR